MAPITLDNVNSRSLIKVIEYCTVHNDPNISPADAKAWDNKFVKVEPSVLCELASVLYSSPLYTIYQINIYYNIENIIASYNFINCLFKSFYAPALPRICLEICPLCVWRCNILSILN